MNTLNWYDSLYWILTSYIYIGTKRKILQQLLIITKFPLYIEINYDITECNNCTNISSSDAFWQVLNVSSALEEASCLNSEIPCWRALKKNQTQRGIRFIRHKEAIFLSLITTNFKHTISILLISILFMSISKYLLLGCWLTVHQLKLNTVVVISVTVHISTVQDVHFNN